LAAPTKARADDGAPGDHVRPRRRVHPPQLGSRTGRGCPTLPGPRRIGGRGAGRAAVRPVLPFLAGAGVTADYGYPFPTELADLPRDRPALIEASAGTGKTYLIEHL